jgi:hypothetical protein
MTVDDLLARFAEIGIAQDKALLYDEVATFNRLYRQMDEVDNELRARGPDAHLALLRLYDHPNMQVRLKAAVRTLGVAPLRARQMLETIAASNYFPQAGDAGSALALIDEGIAKPR